MKVMDGLHNEYEPKKKIVTDYATLAKATEGMRAIGRKIVVTIGSWDLLHIGHVRYLIKAKSHGDFLVVGVDTDRAIKLYKGPLRPVVPQDERCEMLTYQTPVDLVTLVDDVNKKGEWQYGLVSALKPDVFVAVQDSYPESQLAELRKHAGKVIVLPRQAKNTSTSRMIQGTVKKHLDQMYALLDKRS